jgi:excinuclease UvrABC nuclease subunit
MYADMVEIPRQPFTACIDFDPASDFESFLRQAPAKWAVYLFADADDRPVQLLCVKNLRYSLKRRLSGEQTIVLSKRVDYRQIVRKIYFRRVDSAFEADFVYHDLAEKIFPDTYRGMTGFRPAWFVHIDADAPFPRYTKTIDLTDRPGLYLGPLEDKHAAAHLIELAEDAFDLCRYYNILLEAPHGRACAYKEMGKCPAPCDGSISMAQYHRLIDWSVQTIIDPAPMLEDQKTRMGQAAADLHFETASKIKSFIDELSQLGKGPFRHVRPLADFTYVALQHGPKFPQAKAFLVRPGQITEVAGCIDELTRPSELLAAILKTADATPPAKLDPAGINRIGIVAHHLFTARAIHGAFIALSDLCEPALAKSYRDLLRQKRPEETDAEGVQKELLTM